MNVREYLSEDGQAVLALCSALALPEGVAEECEPFKLSEWNRLARAVRDSSLESPAALQGQSAERLAKDLEVSPQDAQRIVRLLERSGRLALELDGLFSRGLWVVTRSDEYYPRKLRDTLKHQAPAVLFGAGEVRLLSRGGLAVVGSRNIDQAGAAFAREVGRRTATAKLPVISGGARGSDRLAMEGGLEADGMVLGVLADSLERTVRQTDLRRLLLEGQLVLVTPYLPTAGFTIGGAMGRNKIIYGLADFAVVVSSDFQSGGTWAGAVEALKAGWCPVFARESALAPNGNRELIKLGAAALPESELSQIQDFPAWLRHHTKAKPTEQDLFG